MSGSLAVRVEAADGLVLHWDTGDGRTFTCPVRVQVRGNETFFVWGTVDSGEGPPAWAEDLTLTLFGGPAESPGVSHEVLPLGAGGWRAVARAPRAEARLDLVLRDGELRADLSLRCPDGAPPLPVCALELRFEGIDPGDDAFYLSAHPYGGRTHGYGRLAGLPEIGVMFIHGCIGQGLPLVYLHSDSADGGVQLEFMTNAPPVAWLPPGRRPGAADWCVTWSLDRLLPAGQVHATGGSLGLAPYRGDPVAAMRRWRDEAPARYGIAGMPAPEWLRRANFIEFNMNPSAAKGFTRLDDPACRRTLERWKDMGYTAIFAVSCNHVGQNWLSPFDYEPREEVGGPAAEARCLAWAHELGFHIILWVTTVGIDRDAPEVARHPDWFTHRPGGDLFYAWESTPASKFVGYAPDADPFAAGWRRWLQAQVKGIIDRGYDGIFIDGCIPRASNHARWLWPGESRNGVEGQAGDLAAYVRARGKDLITYLEDESLRAQASAEMTVGRYTPSAPFLKKAFWDHGMGGGPASQVGVPQRIPPEMARQYLRVRYASLLAGHASESIAEGYYSEEGRPWVVQGLVAGVVPKTHCQFVDDPVTFRPMGDAVEVPAAQRESPWRLRGHEEFLRLLKLRRDERLLHDAPLSIEAVEVEGDAAVVGILRPGPGRAILALVQFADRPARVRVRLAEPVDVAGIGSLAPGPRRVLDEVSAHDWRAREILRSMVDGDGETAGTISTTLPLEVEVAPYGFRILELTPAPGRTPRA